MPAPRASAWEWAQAALLSANLVWTTLCLGGYRPETRVVMTLLTVALMAVHLGARALAVREHTRRTHPAGWLLLPFLGYAAANVLWVSPVPWLGWIDWLGWAQMVAVFWVVLNGIRSPGPSRALFLVLVALGVAGVGAACYQRFVDADWLMLGRTQAPQYLGRASGFFGNPNSFAAQLALLLPVTTALALRRGAREIERVWWGWVTAVLGVGLVLTISRGAAIALALAAMVWPLSNRRWNWKRRVAGAGIVLVLLGAVAWTVSATAPKVRERFTLLIEQAGERSRPILWRAAWQLWRENPFLGSGAGSFNVLFEQHRPERFSDDPRWAHNEYLNTASDYGAVGFGLLFGATAAIAAASFRRSGRDPVRGRSSWLQGATVRRGLAVGLLAVGLQAAVEFHFKIPALGLGVAMVAGLAVRRSWPAETPAAEVRSVRRLTNGFGAAAVLLAGGFLVLPFVRAEAQRHLGREIVDDLARQHPEPSPGTYRAPLAAAIARLRRAVELAPSHAQAWGDLAYATALWAHVEPARTVELGREAEAAAERALAGSAAVFDFWIHRGVARDMQGRWYEAGADFSQAIALAPTNAYAWYNYAHHLSLRPTERGMFEAALAFCLRLDPWNAPAIVLRQRLAKRISAP